MEANANSRNCNHSIHSPSPPTQLLYLHSNLVRPGLETFFYKSCADRWRLLPHWRHLRPHRPRFAICIASGKGRAQTQLIRLVVC
jgi:hypothetical protein